MKQTALYTSLKTLGLPVTYGEFLTPVTPPFITYQYVYSNDLMADDANCIEVSNFQVELYTTKKDLTVEGQVEALLKSLFLPYRKLEFYIEAENLRQIIYEVQLTN